MRMLVIAVLVCCVVISFASPLRVFTKDGLVEGYERSSRNGLPIHAWEGIPFAQPPVGNLRWKDPLPASSWDGVLSCKSIKSQCVQAEGSGNEDCLYLNVYKLGNPSNDGPYPVLYYIYGGGLMFGSATDNFDEFLAHAGKGKGAVVVTVSYRLNIFGFLATEQLSQEQGGVSGNYGIKDQLLGLTWVQNNIEFFGGDKNRVTISGQSSGGTSVFALLSTPLSKGLFHRAISMSGSPNMTMNMRQAEIQNQPIVQQSNCSSLPSVSSILHCMRSKSVLDLLSLIPVSWYTPGIWNLPMSPIGQQYGGLVVVDGKFIPYPFDMALQKGVVDVPFMIGNMQQETDEYPEQDMSNMRNSDWSELLKETFAEWNSGDDIAKRFYEYYYQDSQQNPQKAFDSIVSDYGVICPVFSIMQSALPPVGGFRSPIYVYVNQWNLARPFPRDDSYTVRYAFHYLDFIYLLENWKALGQGHYEPQTQDQQISTLWQTMWFEFMNTGNMESFGWYSINSDVNWPNVTSTFVFSPSNSTMISNYKAHYCQYFNSIGLNEKQFWWVN